MSTSLLRPLALGLCLILVAGLGAALPSYYAGLLTEGLIFAVLAMSLNLLVGYAGLPSLGHAAYFSIGAYAAGLLAVHATRSFWLGALVGMGAGALLGAAFGLLALRTTGVYFLMITLALAQIVWAVAFSWRSVTGGDDGLRAIGRPDLALPGVDLADTSSYFVFALIVVVAAALAMRVIIRSPFGRTLRGVQESQVRMAALGYNVWLHRYIAFILSSAFAGLAGVLFVYYKGFISPEAASIVVSAEVMLMVILGGAGTLTGPVVGALTIVLLSNFVSAYTDRWTLILGTLYIVVMLAAPQGIVGALAAMFARTKEDRNDRAAR
jgi:branched-chain amino acid transport system permease protein